MRESSTSESKSSSVHIVNLAQSADMFYQDTPLAPRLLRHSLLYDLVKEEEIIPLQHLLIQGFPVPGWASYELAARFPFPDLVSTVYVNRDQQTLTKLTELELRQIAGDGFHWSLIGAMLAFAWSTSEAAKVVDA